MHQVSFDDLLHTQATTNSLVADEHARPPREEMDAGIAASPAGQLEPNILPFLEEDVPLVEAAPAGRLELDIAPQHGRAQEPGRPPLAMSHEPWAEQNDKNEAIRPWMSRK